MKIPTILCALLSALFLITACNQDKNQTSASGATQAKPTRVPKNSIGHTCEQQNIDDRIQVTTNPTKVMWIHLISLNGEILKRMPVRNKVTSSGKRLEPATWNRAVVSASEDKELPQYNGLVTPEMIGPDGTYGSSDPYIFWFDPMKRYHQWGTAGGMGYLLTDYPIDLADPIDKITGLYKVQEAAAKWQAEQETKLRQTEKSN
jgi:hypothetical protein